MKLVGEALSKLALEKHPIADRNLYGRSAFNRFYYAAFLITREMLAFLDPKWKSTPHKEIPNRLRDTIRQRLKKSVEHFHRQGIITVSEKSRLINRLNEATEELAEMLERAYDARVIADYKPEKLICIDSNKVISLQAHKLDSARSWPNRASAYCKTIISVWKEAGLA